MTKPKYEAGKIIDLRFTRESMPDRIYIHMVYRKPRSTEWMYQVFSEKNNGIIYLGESQIAKLESKRTAKCYEHDIVKSMYESGFRFCGNSNENKAYERANGMKYAGYIKHIVLRDAVDENGEYVDGQLGLWVMYNSVIDNINSDGGYHQIK